MEIKKVVLSEDEMLTNEVESKIKMKIVYANNGEMFLGHYSVVFDRIDNRKKSEMFVVQSYNRLVNYYATDQTGRNDVDELPGLRSMLDQALNHESVRLKLLMNGYFLG
ncbi:hypothetical protein [Aneurinibacillus tyrosinisolvens]|uniref:hypothetical protein n=1 Tax=Aneurinibacillus tyrosinisolvens TaxID=1443435 RepID=UPI00063F6C56|nr:hypothetical protein [Aneurinibacillus tyrosinisolvens]